MCVVCIPMDIEMDYILKLCFLTSENICVCTTNTAIHLLPVLQYLPESFSCRM